jgi:hypothetical protein
MKSFIKEMGYHGMDGEKVQHEVDQAMGKCGGYQGAAHGGDKAVGQKKCHKSNQKPKNANVKKMKSVKKNKSKQSKVLGRNVQKKKRNENKERNDYWKLIVNENASDNYMKIDFENVKCQKCFKTHFPHRKLCRWVNAKKKEKEFPREDSLNISEETILLINDRVSFLEKIQKINGDDELQKTETNYLKITNSFLKKACNSSSLPDICFQTYNSNVSDERLKLKGGSRLKIFDTEETELSRLLSIFRSLQMFYKFNKHKKCKITSKTTKDSLCTFCLMRSLVLKSKIYQGRQLIKPVEFLCALTMDITSQPTVRNINIIIEKIRMCIPTFDVKKINLYQIAIVFL